MNSGDDLETSRPGEAIEIPEPDYSDSDNEETSVSNHLSFSPSSYNNDPSSDLVPDKVASCPNSVSLMPAEGGGEIPLPDYPEDDNDDQMEGGHDDKTNTKLIISAAEKVPDSLATGNCDNAELISPKKLVNPCLISRDHKALRQELKLNQKLGKNPTEQPELIKVLRERQEKEKKKEMEEHLKSKRTSLELRLEDQAQKLSQAEQQKHQEEQQAKHEEEKPEFFKIHSKIIKTKSTN